jgi:serine/threonine protein kinase
MSKVENIRSEQKTTVSMCRYLHEVCLPAVVHRNFKSGNILLDDELNPHVSDCGIADLSPLGSDHQVHICLQNRNLCKGLSS